MPYDLYFPLTVPKPYFKPSNISKLPTAPSPMTAAAIAKPTSNPLTFFSVFTTVFDLAGGAGGAPAGRAAVAAAAPAAAAAAVVAAEAGRAPGGGGGAPAGRAGAGGGGAPGAGRAALGGGTAGRGAAPGTAAGAAAPVDGGGGPPAGNVGSLIVAVGFGGKLMRTVCFFEGPSGAGAAGGTLGGLSAIFINRFCSS